MKGLLALLLTACSAGPTVSLPTPFAPYAATVGDGVVETSTFTEVVVRYTDVEAVEQWARWTATLEREGYTWDSSPTRAMGMTFDTFTGPDGDVRELIVTGRGSSVIVHLAIK